jgi:hypothetical protein
MNSHWARLSRRGGIIGFAAVVSLVLTGGHASAVGEPAGVAKGELQRFMDAQWTEVRRLKDVDAVVLADLYPRLGGADAISDRGGPFQEGDIRTGEPMRRFVLAGRSSDRWFVCYEQGGLGHHLVLVIFDTTGGKARPLLLARGGTAKQDDRRWSRLNLKQLRRALGLGKMRVEPQITAQLF